MDIERMRQLIINSEMPPEEEYGRKADTASYILPTQENLDSITRELRKKKKREQEKKKVEKKEETKEALRQGQDSTRSPCTRAAGGTPSARTCIPTRS